MQARPQEIRGVRRSGAQKVLSTFRKKRPSEDISTNARPDLVLPCDDALSQPDRFSVPLMSQTPASPQQGLPTPQAFQEGCQETLLMGVHGKAEESQWLHLEAQDGCQRPTRVPPHQCFDTHQAKVTLRARRLPWRLSLPGLASAMPHNGQGKSHVDLCHQRSQTWNNATDPLEVGEDGGKRHIPLHRKTYQTGRKVFRSDFHCSLY